MLSSFRAPALRRSPEKAGADMRSTPLTILALLLVATVAGAVELRWEPRWQCVAPGATGSIAIVLDDAIDIRTIEVSVEYDPDVVTSIGSTAGSIYDGAGCFLWEDCEDETPGFFHAFVVLMGGVCYATGPGELLVWHFTAATQKRAATRRIAAVMNVGTKENRPECNVRVEGDAVRVSTKSAGAATVVEIDLSPDRRKDMPLMSIRRKPEAGKVETLSVK